MKRRRLLNASIFLLVVFAGGTIPAFFEAQGISALAWLVIYFAGACGFAVYIYSFEPKRVSNPDEPQDVRSFYNTLLSNYRRFTFYVGCYVYAVVGAAVGVLARDVVLALLAGLGALILCVIAMSGLWVVKRRWLEALGFYW